MQSHNSAPFHKSVTRGEKSSTELQSKWQRSIPEGAGSGRRASPDDLLMEKMSTVKQLQTLSEDMQWLVEWIKARYM